MTSEMNGLSSGGGNASIVADTTKEIAGSSLTTNGASWTATKDCIMIGGLSDPNQTGYAILYFDGDIFAYGGASYQPDSQYSRLGNLTTGKGVFVPNGTVVSTNASYGKYDLHFYEIA